MSKRKSLEEFRGKFSKEFLREADAEYARIEAEVTELKAYQEKLLCENEIYEQCIANIIDTKPGGSIEGQMIAATQACVRAEQRNEELEKELARATHMAELWKRLAKLLYIQECGFNHGLQIRDDRIKEAVADAKAAEAELAALKNELEEWKDESAANLELAKQTQIMVWEQSAAIAALKKDALRLAEYALYMGDFIEMGVIARRIIEAMREL